jgi:hypothetical protein
MQTRNKLEESKYFLDILPTVGEDPNGFRCNLSAFLNAWRSLLDVMLYDFDEFYNLGFTREVEMNDKEFYAVAKASGNEEAVRFIRWWRQKQGMLKNSPLWEQRIINFHRGGTNIQNYSAVVSGSGGNSGTISPSVLTVPLPADSTLGALVPHATNTTATETPDWYFADFPDKTIIEICSAAYAEWEEIVQEAEREFNVRL